MSDDGCSQSWWVSIVLQLLEIHDIITALIYNITTGWRSILVGTDVSEDGAKNPLKGISMKLLVLALNAQFRVGAGR